MATKKKLLQAAAGSAGGAGGLNVEDVFSTYLYDGNGESQSIDNGINLGQSNDGGSAHFEPDDSSDTEQIALGSANYITSGDFTIECFVWIELLNSTNIYGYEIPTIFYIDSPRLSFTYDYVSPGGSADEAFNLYDTAYRYGSVNQHPASTYTNTWVHVAVVRNSGTIRCYVDGTEAFNYSNTTDYSGATLTIGGNSNGTPLQGHISNFRIVDGTAVYTSNFTPPTSELTAISGTTLLTFTSENTLTDTSSSSHAFTVTGSVSASNFGPFTAASAGEGGLVWGKNRDAAFDHNLTDTERGVSRHIRTNTTDAEQYLSGYNVTSFNSNGFSLGTGNDLNGLYDYVTWTFRKAPKFFDVVTFTVPTGGASQTISHNLDAPVGFVITKLTSSGTANWYCFHTSRPNKYLSLDLTSAEGSWTWSSTNTEIDIGAFYSTNFGGETGVAYFFAHNDGDGDFGSTADQDIIKCGSYTGNGSTNGPEINLGFEPQWLLIKVTSGTTDQWVIFDTMRGLVTGGADNRLFPNLSNAEGTGIDYIEVTPTGFKPTVNADLVNRNTSDYIYIAIRRGPMAVPTDATDVFDAHVATTSSETVNVGFPTDFSIFKGKDFVQEWYATPRLTEGYMQTNATAQEGANPYIEFDAQNQLPTSLSGNYLHLNWKRAPSFCDVVAYTGTGSVRTVSHNLGVAPEMMWIKRRDAIGAWNIYHSALGATKFLQFDTDAESTASSFFNDTEPTDSVFTVGTSGGVNASGGNLIAYLFASLDGVSKVGSFSHTNGGGDTNVDCGFSSGARFVLVKRYDSTGGNWVVLDSVRGIVSGNDPYLLIDSTNAEVTNYDVIDPLSSGFTVADGFLASGNYIFYAVSA